MEPQFLNLTHSRRLFKKRFVKKPNHFSPIRNNGNWINPFQQQKQKTRKIFTAQFPEMLMRLGLIVNWFILAHFLLCHLRGTWLTIQVSSAWKGCWVENWSFVWQPRHFSLNDFGQKSNYSRWDTFEDQGLTVMQTVSPLSHTQSQCHKFIVRENCL